ncbi:hypothetical protein HGG72_07975 [Ochrobactrum pecoris]|uniref:Uncharacterized protein n=1 Tax=Brucella pecoris TaxID=867683 RepID=A0AB34YU78_9HYPH|nr:hypothetical protein [Brucella pecoris]NKW80280.1 hypothetical protein [Brucella pecoris]
MFLIRASNIFKSTFFPIRAFPSGVEPEMALAVSKARCRCRPFANYSAARVIAHMDRQYTHALVLDAKTVGCDADRISHVMRFFEMIEIKDVGRVAACPISMKGTT